MEALANRSVGPVGQGRKRSQADKLTDWYLEKLGRGLYLSEHETSSGACLRVTVCLFYLTIAVGTVWSSHFVGKQMHAVYWISPWPQVTLFVAMMSLAGSFMLLMRVRVVRHARFRALEGESNIRTVADTTKKRSRICDTSRIGLRPIVMISSVLAVFTVGLGLFTGIRGHFLTSALLENCSNFDAEDARKLEKTSDDLVRFQKSCQNGNQVARCPGFRKKFPTPSPYVDYLIHLQMLEGCTGFCRPNLDASLADRASRFSCAEVLGFRVRRVTMLVSMVGVFVGLCTAIIAMFLFDYEHL